MTPSVSFILLVKDPPYEVRDRVQEILEVLAELTRHFDILIVDYGTNDEPDAAMELVREYPQVALIECPDVRELSDAMEAGLLATAGEIVFVDEMSRPFRPRAVRQLWQLRDDERMVTMLHGHSEVRKAPQLASSVSPTLRMLKRRPIGQPRPFDEQKAEPHFDRVIRSDPNRTAPTTEGLPRILSRLRRLAAP